jgi:hypothetical protein
MIESTRWTMRTVAMKLPRDRRELARLSRRVLRGEVFVRDQSVTGNTVVVRYHEPSEPPQRRTKMTQKLDLLLLTLGCEVLALHTLYFDMTDADDRTYERLRRAAKDCVVEISQSEWDSGIIGTRGSAFHPLRGRLEWAARRAGRDDIGGEIAFRRLFGLRATKRLRRDIARELSPSDARRATAMFDLLDQRGPMTAKFIHPPSPADRTKGAEPEGSAFVREKLRKASFKGDILKPVSLSNDEIEERGGRNRPKRVKKRSKTEEEKEIVALYKAGVPCSDISLKVYPSYRPEAAHLRRSKVIRVLKRLGVRLRTASERRKVGNPAFVEGMKARSAQEP